MTDPADADASNATHEWTDATGWRDRDSNRQAHINSSRRRLDRQSPTRHDNADNPDNAAPGTSRPATIVRHVDHSGAVSAIMATPAADLATERALLEMRAARRIDNSPTNTTAVDDPSTDSTEDAAVYVASMTEGGGKRRRLTIDSEIGMLSVMCPSVQRDGAAVGLSALALWQTQCIEWKRPELAGLRRLDAYDDAPPSVALFHLDLCGSPAPLRANDQYGAFMRRDQYDRMVRIAPALLALADRIRRPCNLQYAAAVAVTRQSTQTRGLLGRSDLLCPSMQRLVAATTLLCPYNGMDVYDAAPAFGIDAGHAGDDGSREQLGLAIAAALARLHDPTLSQ
ncbi:hypothetical protein pqer_cds_268 [Pandoravirus quercus]|uniref:Uncharacterized protein n=2 Tax=Pandoravirus TaxID=2060084 RepID=A0A2U7U8D7_9VIRU|nr:hypothetical protein pqer_cds_268 [Pandoravirus quercus]AVK74690.1 hypothetical protein pqer_cds_268 [Pandoravirus quercus]QBZ80867.1 hypothetical protein pclt_cds_269 [Pandoravirus celtis]